MSRLALKEQVRALIERGASYEEAGRQAGIPAGQAYLIATGLPADGSDVLAPEALRGREQFLIDGSQHLVSPAAVLPKHESEVEEWIKQRARTDRHMHETGASRSAEPPPIEGAEQTDDVISVLGWDHNQVRVLLKQLQAIPGVRKGGSAAHRQRRVSIVDLIRARLSRHETVEDCYFWPAVRDALPDGDELAGTATTQEQEGKEILQALQGLSGDDERFDELIEKLVAAVRKHVAFEETVFLRIEEQMPQEQRDGIGRRIRSVEPAGRHGRPQESEQPQTEGEAGKQ